MRTGQTLGCGWMACCCPSLRHQIIVVIMCVFLPAVCLLLVSLILWIVSHSAGALMLVGQISGLKSCLHMYRLGGFPGGSNGKRICLQCTRPGFDPWRGERLPTPVLLPGEFHGQRSLVSYIVQGVEKSQTRLSDFHFHFSLSPELLVV